MIKSNTALLYDARDGEKRGIVVIAVNSWVANLEGITYTATDYCVTEGVRTWIGEKTVFRSWDQLNSLNDYLESSNNFSGLTKKQREFMKIKHGLLLETQTKPVYGSVASNWVFTENDDI